MSYLNLIATSAFGLESVVVRELKNLGIEKTEVDNGRINYTGDYISVINSNLWLRCADRVLIKLAEFKAYDFEQLFQGTLSVNWPDFIPVNGKMHVIGKSVNSKLHSVPGCQSIVKKAIIEAMKKKYRQEWFDESGPVYRVEISMLDTSGLGLHKRGYREGQGEAPLKETLAAGLVYLSRWRRERVFADPMCGSGTIAIEAALMGRNIAPGLLRGFSSQEWPEIPQTLWKRLIEEAQSLISSEPLEIFASDIDKKIFSAAVRNAGNAGVRDSIIFQKKPVSEFSSSSKYGCIVCNPPYGERMKNDREVQLLYRGMGEVFSKLDTWSFFIMTSNEHFEKSFGRKADKNRKLYNGDIKTYLYQYFGPRPQRKA
jgi:putative N6-adenine-specific DNA methylase